MTVSTGPCAGPFHRYARHVALAQIGEAGQARIAAGRVLIIGLGGLGCPAALYLASSGVGELRLNDFDRVDETNLQRQVLYREADIGERKAVAAARALAAVNPDCRLQVLDARLDEAALRDAVAAADLVLDGSDNFATRFAVNAACIATATPLVCGAAIRFEGQLCVIRPDVDGAPCYRCLYGEGSDDELEDCRGNGVLAPLVGTIGSLMAVEALKVLLGRGEESVGRLLVFDALTLDWRSLKFGRDPACPVCAER
jgi:molybdopterin/thiamine biosynthesis adenylyltransferase